MEIERINLSMLNGAHYAWENMEQKYVVLTKEEKIFSLAPVETSQL